MASSNILGPGVQTTPVIPPSTSACHRVFAVVELREEILLNLSLNELLRSFRVCRAWATSTRRIRQALYLEPTDRRLELSVNVWNLQPCDSIDEEESAASGEEMNLLYSDRPAEGDRSGFEVEHAEEAYDTDEKMHDPDRPDHEHTVGNEDQTTDVSKAEPDATLDPSRGPVLNPFINNFLHTEYDGHPTLRSLGIVTFPSYVNDDDGSEFDRPGSVIYPSYLVWKLKCSVETFRNQNASWRKMQVMQPAATEMFSVCVGYEMDIDSDDGRARDYEHTDYTESGITKLETFGQQYGVTNPNGVTLGQWIDMYQEHHSTCPHCVFMADEYDPDYGYDHVPFDRWMYFASGVTRKLEPNISAGKETFKACRDNGKDAAPAQLVVPGSGFTGHYVLSSIEETLRPRSQSEPAASQRNE